MMKSILTSLLMLVTSQTAFASLTLLENELGCLKQNAQACMNASVILQKSGNIRDAERRSYVACQLDKNFCAPKAEAHKGASTQASASSNID